VDLGKKHEAMEDYNKAIELDPNCTTAYNNRADLRLKLHQCDKALEDVNRAISLDNKKYAYYITKGEIYMDMKKYLDAIKEFTFALSLKDDVKDVYKYRGECYRELAKVNSGGEKEYEYNVLAEADEKKYEELDKRFNSQS
jgi:tetratricopeptide (TPR) repeat protein